jgi:PAT family beta-lactamase induction signal transducer AmpG
MNAAIDAQSGRLVLTESRNLRLLTLFLFYFTQGLPLGIFLLAIPTWMASGGASISDTAWVVGISFLPWSLKLLNGFVLDRYTYLPMGRRRAWIIGAQLCVSIAFLAGAFAAPSSGDILLIGAIGFCANLAVTVQDVAIDALAIDIMEVDERSKASGIMFGAQTFGVSSSTALIGYLLDNYDFRIAMICAAFLPAAIALFGIAIKERAGERRMPWGNGSAHPKNLAIQVNAWLPLLKNSMKAMVTPLSLMLIPIMLIRAVPFGAFEAFHPVLAVQRLGWSITEYTGMLATAQFSAATAALFLGTFFGSRKSLIVVASAGVIAFMVMGFSQSLWTDAKFFAVMIFVFEFVAIFVAVSVIPICMHACSPIVAATQFTLFMALSNFGRPIGATVAGITAGQDSAVTMYITVAAAYVIIVILAVLLPMKNAEGAEPALIKEEAQTNTPRPRFE